MSRNKFILLVAAIAVAFVATPNTGTFQIIKMNFINLLPFILAAIIVYLIITITMVKRAWKKVDQVRIRLVIRTELLGMLLYNQYITEVQYLTITIPYASFLSS